MTLFPYCNSSRGVSYGLEYPFRWERREGGGAVVFNVVDGAIWSELPAHTNVLGYDWARVWAANLCLQWNSIKSVDTAGIDATP